MLTKKQKIWTWIFLAMFLVPEILWSPISNFYFELLQTSKSGGTYPFRDNFLQNSDNLNYLKIVILLQFIGLLLSLILIIKNRKWMNKLWRYLLIALLFILFIITGFALYFVFSFSIDIF